MMQTLGKIPNLFLILFLTIIASADVKVSVNSQTIYQDDVVNFTITADGKNIEFPKLTTIGGQLVSGISQSKSDITINGETTRTISTIYNFVASESFIIPQYLVTIDGVKHHTKELSIKVLQPKASEDGSEFVLEIALDKKVAYVGEPITLSVSFKAKKNSRAKKIELDEPKLENFWVKKIEEVQHSTQKSYMMQTLHYKLFPQKSGEYTIPAIKALIGKIVTQRQKRGMFIDPFFSTTRQHLEWQKIYSNTLELEVKPLPNQLELFGNYQIQATVEKQEIEANKPINLTIFIKGEGNIDDIKKFKLNIDNVIIYADEPNISTQESNTIYQGAFTQKIALIGDRDFTIPPLHLEYFDKESKSVKKISTKAIDIKVIGGEAKATQKPSSIEINPTQLIQAPQKVETKIIIEKEDAYLKYLFLAIGFILGIALVSILNYLKNRTTHNEPNIIKSIKKAKDDKVLFTLLLPYAKENKIISDALNRLEENLYKNGIHKIDKEELMEFFEENFNS